MSDKNLEEKLDKISHDKYERVYDTAFFTRKEAYQVGFKEGYELAQKEMQKELDHLKEQLKIAQSYCEVYVADIQNANKIITEAIEVIKMFHHDDYDERVKAYERSRYLLKARNE